MKMVSLVINSPSIINLPEIVLKMEVRPKSPLHKLLPTIPQGEISIHLPRT